MGVGVWCNVKVFKVQQQYSPQSIVFGKPSGRLLVSFMAKENI